jgi:flagellar biosynthesis protein FlhA
VLSVLAAQLRPFAIPAGVTAIIVMLIVPLPPAVVDLLITLNLAGSLVVLLMSMFITRPLDLSIFPTLLLIATMFRLALNVSVTRLVLTDGYAGEVVKSFGEFVIGGSIVVGLVIFLILIIIQFLVVTNGAGRVAEVAARFTLDAMPGKQMAIDADLNAGLLTEDQARERRKEVASEAEFYGAMDGASKFVKGDAIAAIIITVINLLGGFAIGMLQKGMSAGEAVSHYSLLTVGDGLSSQIPALMLSIATGIIVTRATSDGDLGSDVLRQFAAQKRALQLGGVGILALALVPALPKIPFLLVGALVIFISTRVPDVVEPLDANAETAAPEVAVNPDSPEALMEEMRVDPITLEVAYDVVDLVDPSTGGDLLARVKGLRRKLALELGIVLPPVRTRDDLELELATYVVRLHGVEVARGKAPAGRVMALGDNLEGLPGEETREPVFGLPAKWIAVELQRQAEISGCTVVDRASVVTTHLAEVVRENAAKLLGREDVKALVDTVRRSNPTVVEELTPTTLTLGEVHRVLQALLEERVPIRDLARIFEAMSSRARTSTDLEGLVEAARGVVGPAICAAYSSRGTLQVITLDPMLEQELLGAVRPGEQGSFLLVDGALLGALGADVGRIMVDAERNGQAPVLVCSPQIRASLRRLLRGEFPRLGVLSYGELGGSMDIQTIGVVSVAQASAARGA